MQIFTTLGMCMIDYIKAGTYLITFFFWLPSKLLRVVKHDIEASWQCSCRYVPFSAVKS